MKTTSSRLARDLLLVALYNAAIGIFLTVLTGFGLANNLIYSSCIGFSIYAFLQIASRLRGQDRPDWVSGAVGIPLGFAVGFTLATWINGLSLTQVQDAYPGAVLASSATALLFGALGTWHFHNQARLFEAQAEARTERLRRSEQEALAARAELARLQAQIEPHFLFNTLSNVVGLIDTEPAAARAMLLDLTALLRTSLARSRKADVTLGEEIELLRAYLGIMAVRMGNRLDWRIEAADAVLAARLPPLLVQPLVENAIRHGLEPKPEGGSLAIRCRRGGTDTLEIEVEDHGRGFAATGSEGLGLANVRARLRSCYGEAASLSLETNAAGGVSARLRLPFNMPEPPCAS